MVVAARAMRVAVLELFGRGVTERLHGDLEVKRLASKRMIRIDRDGLFADASDEERNLPALIIVREDLHPGGKLGIGREEMARNLLGFTDPRSVSLLGRNRGLDGLALTDALELLFQTRNDVHRSMQVEKRAPVGRLVDDLAVVVAQCVRERHDLVCCDSFTHGTRATMA
mgnify:CR=1 FL=1